MRTSSANDFVIGLKEFTKLVKQAKKNRLSLTSHHFYAPKARTGLADLRKNFLMMKRDYPEERFPRVTFQLATIEPLVSKLVELFPSSLNEMQRLLDEISFKVDSDLAAELDAPQATPLLSTATPFLPNDLIDNSHHVLQKTLWEANRCYDAACYNACAAMIRRLVEHLIIEAFERHNIADRIKQNAEYIEFGTLIGKAIAEPMLRLTRNTKRVLPELKFFGDLGAHNRMALVRKDDLDRLHSQIRAGVEELASNL